MENLDDEEEELLEVPAHLKKMLMSEVDVIRDAFDILLVFVEGATKTTVKALEDIENIIPDKNEPTS